ncbi:MAG: hypothetical protein E6R13_09130 [Spirochaetes bacterium]|nr:MAG: hypothetical protein E6R13_09130 [Spirochaetota bacterium]
MCQEWDYITCECKSIV